MEKIQQFPGQHAPVKRVPSLFARYKAVAIASLLALSVVFHFHQRCQGPAATGGRHVYRYAGEAVEWRRCGDLGDRPLECATINVPADHFSNKSTAAASAASFSLPLMRARGSSDAAKNILLNPGGPGGSGVSLLHRRGRELAEIVGDDFHLVGFDPRGINGSRPLASCYPDDATRRELSAVRDADLVRDAPELWAWSHNFARACADNMQQVAAAAASGETVNMAAYVNTPQTAADMNDILDALGQEDMYYWGFSYGTLLGQTYATMFPERSRRVIIDGVGNQFDWYQSWYDKEWLADVDNVFDGFLDECVKAGAKNCSLASLAGSKEELYGVVMDFMEALKEQPMNVYVNTSMHGLLTHQKIWYNGVFYSMYKPTMWWGLADRLAKLIQGNATEAFLAYAVEEPIEMPGEANKMVMINDGVGGPGRMPEGRDALVEELLDIANSSIFGIGDDNPMYFIRQQWKLPRQTDYAPKKSVKTAHPLLIMSTTYDPVCPLISAKSARDTFVGSQIVEVEGYGHCSLAMPSLCAAKRVRAFLANGTVPAEHVKCAIDSDYFVDPDDRESDAATGIEGDEEDGRLLAALQRLARDWDGSYKGL